VTENEKRVETAKMMLAAYRADAGTAGETDIKDACAAILRHDGE
jgi:hypothetical protein